MCAKLSTKYFIFAVLIGTTTDFYHSLPLSVSDLYLGLGSQGQRRVKLLGFIFSHTVQLMSVKFDTLLTQFKLNILILRSDEI